MIAELRKLRNVRYHDRPVSLYGGIVDLPLIVQAEEEPAWFADTETLLDERLWAGYEAQYRGETERMAQELRDNLLGTAVWSRLEPTTRSFLASAVEKLANAFASHLLLPAEEVESQHRERFADGEIDYGDLVEMAREFEVSTEALVWRFRLMGKLTQEEAESDPERS